MDKKRILLIEDDIEMRETTECLLDSFGYSVVTANDGREALGKILVAHANRIMFDLIITDVYMPWITGVGVIQKIKEMKIDVPVIAITGFATEEIRENMINKGCDGLLEKPFTKEQLKKIVAALLEKREMHVLKGDIKNEPMVR